MNTEPCNCPQALELQTEVARLRALLVHYTDQRQVYVRQHAPVILAGYLTQTHPQGVTDRDIREQAIRTAGLLWDETTGEGK